MDAPATPVPFRITTDGRTGTIEVDGTDITESVAGLSFDAGYGEPARLTIQLRPGSTGVLDGAAVVQVATGAPAGDAVRALDLDQVQGAIASRPVDLSTNLIATALEVVAELLDEMST